MRRGLPRMRHRPHAPRKLRSSSSQPADGLPVIRPDPAIAPLRKLENLGRRHDCWSAMHEWLVHDPGAHPRRRRSPRASAPTRRRAGPAAAPRPARSRAPEAGTGCGGTPGNDVICAYGGRDIVTSAAGTNRLWRAGRRSESGRPRQGRPLRQRRARPPEPRTAGSTASTAGAAATARASIADATACEPVERVG